MKARFEKAAHATLEIERLEAEMEAAGPRRMRH